MGYILNMNFKFGVAFLLCVIFYALLPLTDTFVLFSTNRLVARLYGYAHVFTQFSTMVPSY